MEEGAGPTTSRSCGIPHGRENSECEIRKLESGPPSSRGCGTMKGALKGRGAGSGRRRRVETISNDVPTGHE